MNAQIIPFPTEPALIIYSLYPLKVSRPQALRAISKAIKAFGFDFIKERTELYAKLRGDDKAFMPYPATWYNGQRFNDDPETWLPRGKSVPVSPYNLKTTIDAKEKLCAELKFKHSYEDAFGFNWSNLEAKEKFKSLRGEIKTLTTKLAEL